LEHSSTGALILLILGIETSCDETAASIVEDGKIIRSNVVASQLSLHRRFGGVVPELASRAHLQAISPVLEKACQQAGVSLQDLGGIAVTYGPGLIGSLLVGVSVAKSLSYVHNLPFIGINHLEGHIHSASLSHSINPPFVSLIASGGHTSLVFIKGDSDYKLLGATRDDAAGEAYDKVAQLLGLGYPGGPEIDKLAQRGDKDKIRFPRPYLPNSFDFSFSGLKTAVLYYLRDRKKLPVTGFKLRDADYTLPGTGKLSVSEVADIAASFQAAVVDVLVKKSFRAVMETKVKTLVVGGGVTANRGLRKALRDKAEEDKIKVYMPPPDLATDNAAMVAASGYHRIKKGERSNPLTLNAVANLSL